MMRKAPPPPRRSPLKARPFCQGRKDLDKDKPSKASRRRIRQWYLPDYLDTRGSRA